jgi:hypothetical protein
MAAKQRASPPRGVADLHFPLNLFRRDGRVFERNPLHFLAVVIEKDQLGLVLRVIVDLQPHIVVRVAVTKLQYRAGGARKWQARKQRVAFLFDASRDLVCTPSSSAHLHHEPTNPAAGDAEHSR